jgi:hypothetical protein
MFNFLKTKLPTGHTKEMVEIESWTLQWITRGDGYENHTHFKVFTSKPDAEEYGKRLEEANKFLLSQNSLDISLIKNS